MATPSQMPTQREVRVYIRENNGTLEVEPDRFWVSKQGNQDVRWICTSGKDFQVDFGDDSPFHESTFNQDYPCSGLARREIQPSKARFYKYTVRVDGKFLDPDGGVDR